MNGNFFRAFPERLRWVENLDADPVYGNIRFKLLRSNVNPELDFNMFDHLPDLFDFVEWISFCEEEPNRIPMLVDNQRVLLQKPWLLPGFNRPKRLFALLNRNPFFGDVFCVSICQIVEQSARSINNSSPLEWIKLVDFSNGKSEGVFILRQTRSIEF